MDGGGPDLALPYTVWYVRVQLLRSWAYTSCPAAARQGYMIAALVSSIRWSSSRLTTHHIKLPQRSGWLLA